MRLDLASGERKWVGRLDNAEALKGRWWRSGFGGNVLIWYEVSRYVMALSLSSEGNADGPVGAKRVVLFVLIGLTFCAAFSGCMFSISEIENFI